uniref:Inositol-pentakisphosphate 2-kinase n=1 Tax=Kalanchoe fedtschenkoi TaxID=63787 RepID=A0A7N0VI84_KALFE
MPLTGPTEIGKVLRVQKVAKNGSDNLISSTVLTSEERLLWKDVKTIISSETSDVAAQNYVRDVMTPLLGAEHVDAGVRVRVSVDFLESIDKNVLPHRPAWRVDAARVNPLCDSALLISDHSVFHHGAKGMPCLSVEIKPKCGFLPPSKYISEENHMKKSISRFRMHQALKLHRKEVSEISHYDPLDMFSGIKNRIYKAMRALFSTPQNNFRIFLNGSIIFGGSGGGTNATNSKTAELLEDALGCFIRAEEGKRTEALLQLVTETLHEASVLDKLLEVQKLDAFDIEGAIHAYYNVVSEPCKVCQHVSKDQPHELHTIPFHESLEIARNYLIAATAKDCSLIISFRRKGDSNSASLNEQEFDHKAFFIDLDMKSLDRMKHYYELDQEIVSNYNKVMRGDTEGDPKKRLQSNGHA